MLLKAIACTDDWSVGWLVGWLTLVDFGCQTSFLWALAWHQEKIKGLWAWGLCVHYVASEKEWTENLCEEKQVFGIDIFMILHLYLFKK